MSEGILERESMKMILLFFSLLNESVPDGFWRKETTVIFVEGRSNVYSTRLYKACDYLSRFVSNSSIFWVLKFYLNGKNEDDL